MWVYLIFLLFVTAILLISFFSIEAWPFSAYPMFSRPIQSDSISAFYLELESQNGVRMRCNFKRAVFQKKMDQLLRRALISEDSEKIESSIRYLYNIYLVESKVQFETHLIHLQQLKTTLTENRTESNTLQTYKATIINPSAQ